MRRNALFYGFIVLAALALASCVIVDGEVQVFHSVLWGTWETSGSPNITLEIGMNTIKIGGTGNPRPQQPLSGYPKNFTLVGYSEETSFDTILIGSIREGNLFIRVAGAWEGPLPYTLETLGSSALLTLKGSTTANNLNFNKR